jgi:hypothetical protein
VNAVRKAWIPVAAVAAAAVFGCAGAVWGNHVARTGSVAVELPDPRSVAGDLPRSVPADFLVGNCVSLIQRLPATLEGRDRRKIVPTVPAYPGGDTVPNDWRAAAWGSPATLLKCGVKEPAAITVGGPDYTPLSNRLANVDGVNWIVEDQTPDSVKFTTTDRLAYVEVYVPGDPTHATDVLVDLAPLIIATDPAKDGSGLVPDKS